MLAHKINPHTASQGFGASAVKSQEREACPKEAAVLHASLVFSLSLPPLPPEFFFPPLTCPFLPISDTCTPSPTHFA